MPTRRPRPSATPAPILADPQLPPYQTPTAPLNAQSQRTLRDLQNKNLETLTKHFKEASEFLTTSAFETQETLANQQDWLRKRLEKTGEGDAKYKAKMLQVETLVDSTDELKTALESKIRQSIDAQEQLRARNDILKELSANAASSNGRVQVAATQSTLGASQFRSARIEDDEDDDENEPTTPQVVPGLHHVMQQKLKEHKNKYEQMSLAQRYAEHNDYVEFRKVLHEGKYAPMEQIPIMPNPQTWFDATGPVFSIGSQVEAGTQRDNEEESDVEAVAENINVKCPITLRVMQDPVKSNKCPHTFERSGINDLLRASDRRTGGRSSQKIVGCPVCSVMLSAADLVPDAALKRRIERIAATQVRNHAHDDEDEDMEGAGQTLTRAQTVDSQFEPNLAILTQIKTERVSGVTRQSMARAKQNIESANHEEEEDEDDAERRLRPSISTAEVVDLPDSEDE